MSKVVTFARNADYLHQRAMQNRRQGHLLDALDLMRRAQEREPHNLDYHMDLAELLCEMGCHMGSNRELLAILAGVEPVSECYYGISCNFLAMRDARAAYSAMMRFLSQEPGAVERDEVRETLLNLVRPEQGEMGRRQRRALGLYARAQAELRAGDLKRGARALVGSLAQHPEARDARALLSLCLMMLGQRRGAQQQVRIALRTGTPDVRTRCIAAQIYWAQGHVAAARQQIHALEQCVKTPDERRMLVHLAGELGRHRLVAEQALLALRETPYDIWLLHMRAAALVNLGKPDEARRYWRCIVRLDPNDTVAGYLAQQCEQGDLDRMPYGYQVDDQEHARRLHALAQLVEAGPDAIREWQASPLPRMVRWALASGGRGAQMALALLTAIESPEAELLLREYLILPDAPERLKMQALSILVAHEAPKPHLMLGADGQLRDALGGDVGEVRFSPGCRRVLSIVARAQQSNGRSAALVEPLLMRYLEKAGRTPRIRHPKGWAAALVVRRLGLGGDPGAMHIVKQVFGCSERMVRHCLRQIDRVLGNL